MGDVSLSFQGVEGQGVEGQGVEGQGVEGQGVEGQGVEGQGVEGQGTNLRGHLLQSFANASGPITSVTLNGTVFNGIASSGATLSGAAFIGATMTAVRRDASTFTMRIDDIQPTADPDIYLYQLSYHDGSQWRNPCGTNSGVPVLALPLTGRWDYSVGTPTGGDFIHDPSMFTFGCTTAVLAKCALVGYKPWASFQECNGSDCHVIPGRAYHQACTRMYRADYCANGRAHTVNGTLINIYDNVGVQFDESTTMTLEAEWTPEGAKCVKHLRWTSGGQAIINAAQADIDANCPGIDDYPATSLCGAPGSTFTTAAGYATPLAQRSLIRNESSDPPSGGN
jgi:hypothetical protein